MRLGRARGDGRRAGGRGWGSAPRPASPRPASERRTAALLPASRRLPDGLPGFRRGRHDGAPHRAVSEFPQPGAGSLHATQNVGAPLTCTGYTVKDPNWFNFYVGDTNPAGIGFSATLTVPDTDPGHVQVCFGSPSPFTARSGDPAKRATLPNGDPGFVGLLSHCVAATPKAKKKPLPAPAFTGSVRRPARLAQAGSDPCVLGITTSKDAGSTTGVDTTVTVSIPQGDPWMRA